MPLIFTTIQHSFRKANKLTCNEYVLADMIYQLSRDPDSDVKDWCYMSRVTMSEEIGVSKQSILNLIEALIKKGFVEKNAKTSFLKTTKAWNLVYFTDGKESLPEAKKVILSGKESLLRGGKESLPNNYNLNNNTDNNNINTGLFSDQKIIPISKFQQAIERFLKMRKDVLKKPVSEDGLLILKKTVMELAKGDEEMGIKILDQSVMNSYQGVFALNNIPKKNNNQNQQNNVRTTTPQPANDWHGTL